MSDIKLPYIKLSEIRVVDDMDEANDLIRLNWVYLGFFARTIVPDFGMSEEKAYQKAAVVLGYPSPDQDL